MKQRIITADKIVTVETVVTEDDRVVDYSDIEQRVEYDEWYNETPWESCDGWEHEFVGTGYYDHDDRRNHYSYVNRAARDGGCGFIIVTDESVIEWGCVGPTGCSKQVRFEAIAAAKRKATEQLVKWYENGWEWFTAVAEFEGYMHCVGGIDCMDYAEEVARECAAEVVDELERDGYIVENQPEPQRPYNAVDAFKRRIHYNLTGEWK